MSFLLTLLTAAQIATAPDTTYSEIVLLPDSVRNSNIISLENDISKKYGLDTLDLHLEVLPASNNCANLATYDFSTDSLKINYYEISLAASKNYQNMDSLFDAIIRHEVRGHHMTDKLCEKIGVKLKLEDEKYKNIFTEYSKMLKPSGMEASTYSSLLEGFLDIYGKELMEIMLAKMISEGIGKYYENPNLEPLIVDNYPSIENINSIPICYYFLYDIGYNTMYPIIKEYGDQGIEYVLKNMPQVEDFSNLKSYQKRVMDALKKG